MVSLKDGFAFRFKFNSLIAHFVSYPKQLKVSFATIFKQKENLV